MKNTRKSIFFKILIVVLAVVMALPSDVFAAQPEEVMPTASYYFDAYSLGISAKGNGKLTINFSVLATGDMDYLGVKGITLYESEDQYDWFAVEVYYSSDNTNMMSSDDIYHESSVSYQGVAGRYYQASLTFYAEDSNGSDTTILWTSVRRAT